MSESRLDRFMDRFGKYLDQLLFAFMSANLAWAWTIPGNKIGQIVCAFFWGYALITCVRSLLIQQDIDQMRRELEMSHVRQRQSVQMFPVRTPESVRRFQED